MSSASRLLFFTLALFACGSEPPPSATESELPTNPADGKWVRESFPDSPSVVALSVPAEESVMGWVSRGFPKLVLRCKQGRTDVFIQNDLQSEGVAKFGKTHYYAHLQYDQRQSRTLEVEASESGRAFFLPLPIAEMHAMLAADTLHYGFTPFRAEPVQTRFDLRGLNRQIQVLQDACPWP